MSLVEVGNAIGGESHKGKIHKEKRENAGLFRPISQT